MLCRILRVSQADPNKIASTLFEQPEWEENTGSTKAECLRWDCLKSTLFAVLTAADVLAQKFYIRVLKHAQSSI